MAFNSAFMPRAVLFDFDGVLADTENVHVAAWERTFARMGLEIAPEICARSAEQDDRSFLAMTLGGLSISDGDIEGWVTHKQSIARSLLADTPRLYAGAAELLTTLQGRVRMAVVSGTCRENVSIVLRAVGLEGVFELIAGKEDSRLQKPQPEAYRVALSRLGVVADEAVALEDSPIGLASARAAGIRVIAVGHRREAGEWSEGVDSLPDLSDLKAAVLALGLPPDKG